MIAIGEVKSMVSIQGAHTQSLAFFKLCRTGPGFLHLDHRGRDSQPLGLPAKLARQCLGCRIAFDDKVLLTIRTQPLQQFGRVPILVENGEG